MKIIPFSVKLLLGTLGFCLSLLADDPFYFIIRVDDIQSRINWMPLSIIPFQDAVESRSAKVSWAVIPHRLLESQNSDGVLRGDLLNSIANGHEIIQHGYNHICPNCGQSSHEMFCTQFNTAHADSIQVEMVQGGRNILRDSLNYSPTCFVPPGHVADSQTYEILTDCGFEFLSTTDPLYENEDHDLFNLPPNNEYTWALTLSTYAEKLQQALDDIELKASLGNYYCLLLHDPFIREGYENGVVIEWTVELLDSLQARYGDSVEFRTLSEVAQILHTPPTKISQDMSQFATFMLFDNYPNPFNPVTTICYTILQDEKVGASIYDSRGVMIKTLIKSTYISAGVHTVQWEGTDNLGLLVESGIYFYRMTVGSESKNIKMVLLR